MLWLGIGMFAAIALGFLCVHLQIRRSQLVLSREILDLSRRVGSSGCYALSIEKYKTSLDYCKEQEEKLEKSLEFYRKLEAATPTQERWKLSKTTESCLAEAGLVPVTYLPRSEIILAHLDLLRRLKGKYHSDDRADDGGGPNAENCGQEGAS